MKPYLAPDYIVTVLTTRSRLYLVEQRVSPFTDTGLMHYTVTHLVFFHVFHTESTVSVEVTVLIVQCI